MSMITLIGCASASFLGGCATSRPFVMWWNLVDHRLGLVIGIFMVKSIPCSKSDLSLHHFTD